VLYGQKNHFDRKYQDMSVYKRVKGWLKKIM